MRSLPLVLSLVLGIVACGNTTSPPADAGAAAVAPPTATTPPKASAAPDASAPQPVNGVFKIVVDGWGFTPSDIKVKVGEPVSLEFTRITDETCVTKVVFPELKITKALPLNTPITVTVPSDAVHSYGFQCGMAMDTGTVVIE